MKNKKNTMTVAILALIFLLGVGYAVISSVNLTITGSAGAQSESINVSFNGTTAVSNSSKVQASSTAGTLGANITVSDLTLNETVTATYTVVNKETDVAAVLDNTSITNNKSTYFEVITSINQTAGSICPDNGTATVTVSVKMIKTPVTTADSTANITLNYTATPVDVSTTNCQQ